MEKEAVIVVDYQNDFANPEAGSLYVNSGETIAPEINQIVKEAKQSGAIILASRELHPAGHISFASNFKGKEPITEAFKSGKEPNEKNFITQEEVKNWTEEKNGLNTTAEFSVEELKAYLATAGDQEMWPEHCVKESFGAEYFEEFDSDMVDVEIKKGYEANSHPYSAFGGKTIDEKNTTLEVLEKAQTEIIKVIGLATDYCDVATVIDGIKAGFKVEFISKAAAGVDPSDTIKALEEMRKAGAKIID